jgi:hypothetical protein
MTVIVSKPAVNLREELASLRNQGGYQEQQFYFDGLVTNGTFDGDVSGWTGGAYDAATGDLSLVSAASINVYQSTFDATKQYLLTYTVSEYTSGNISAYNGAQFGPYTNAVGTYSIVVQPIALRLGVRGQNGPVDAKISGIAVYETDGTDVIHRMPKGWVPKDVYEDGLLQREGSAHDYEVVYDGFDYVVKPTVAPSATTQTCVIGVKA